MRIENCSSPMWVQGLGISMVSNSTIHAPQVNVFGRLVLLMDSTFLFSLLFSIQTPLCGCVFYNISWQTLGMMGFVRISYNPLTLAGENIDMSALRHT